MTEKRYLICFILPVLVVLAILATSVAQAAQDAVGHPNLIEVFTVADSTDIGNAAISWQLDYREIETHIYELGGIQRIEARLSKGLTSDPEQAKRIVLQTIQQFDEESRTQMQRAATGLVRAVQYGIDRYPAIVFDSQAVVYGVIDLKAALAYYQAWRTAVKS